MFFSEIDDGPLLPFHDQKEASFHASLLQVIDAVMFLALCLQVVSQTPQYFRSSAEKH